MLSKYAVKTTNLWPVFGVLLAAPSLYGGLVAWQSIVSLELQAHSIVVGSANGGTRAGPVLSFAINVNRVLKGDSSMAGSVIPVEWLTTSGGSGMTVGAHFSATGNGLWFLQRSASGWRLLPVMQGDVDLSDTFIPQQPGPILSTYAYRPATPLSDKVASEVSAAIENADGGADRFYATSTCWIV